MQRGERIPSPYELTYKQTQARTLHEVELFLKDCLDDLKPSVKEPSKQDQGRVDWINAISTCESPRDFLARVEPHARSHQYSPEVAYAQIDTYETTDELLPQPTFIACLELIFPDGELSTQDIAEALRRCRPISDGRVLGVAYTKDSEGFRRTRAFVFRDQCLRATELIDPVLPGSRAAWQFSVLARDAHGTSFSSIEDAFSIEPLRGQFHEEVSKWFKDGLPSLNEQQRSNRLRHLIRVMFAWLLQTRGILPEDTMWLPNQKTENEFAVHEHLKWLFTNVLAKPKRDRKVQEDGWRQLLASEVPFLNGSLFSLDSSELSDHPINNYAYLGSDGLLSILSRYAWTLSDHTAYESESALDPSMLGLLFERLILDVDGPRHEADGHVKMPGGTYYTPQDIVDEMVADAIGCRLCGSLKHTHWQNTRMLAHPLPDKQSWDDWSPMIRRDALRAINEFTFLDPCCGSGAFTLGMLYGLGRAKARLSGKESSIKDFENIIERQLYAVDAHPMAVLITRLRIFIALIDAKIKFNRDRKTDTLPSPLPNLETRCIVANTLYVDPQGQYGLDSNEWDEELAELRATREAWTVAHLPEEKQYALEEDRKIRRRLRSIGSGWKSESDLEWLDVDFLIPNAPPSKCDLRDLFPAPEGGWDIVIGNPPYQTPDISDKERAAKLGYIDTSQNLYLMFIQAAIEVSHEEACVTLIVPHSIVFRGDKAFQKTRAAIEYVAKEVHIRTYDNGPQSLFPKLPWLKGKGGGNHQRCTVLVIQRTKNVSTSCTLMSPGLIRIQTNQRNDAIRAHSKGSTQRAYEKQWTQAPTSELVELLHTMRAEHKRVNQHSQGSTITFQATGRYFLSFLPLGVFDDLHRERFELACNEFYWPWIGLFNSHLFHAYWLMMGDAFHLTAREIHTVQMPPAWQNEGLRRETEVQARQLMESSTLKACKIDYQRKGKLFPNFNFHKEGSPGPAIIRKLDELLLDAYELPREPLLEQMRTIRQSSAHFLD